MKQIKSLQMKPLYFLAIFIPLAWSQPSLAFEETIQTADGRIILLKDDGTYEVQYPVQQAWQDFLQERPPLFRKAHRDFSDTIDYMPKFRNISGKEIVGIEFATEFQSAFGKTIMKLSGTAEERVYHGQSTQAEIFYTFKNNEFIDGESYDKLLPLVVQNTGKQVLIVKAIAFADGDVIQFPEGPRPAPTPLSEFSPGPQQPPAATVIHKDRHSKNRHFPPRSQSKAIKLTERSKIKTSDLLPIIRNGTRDQMKQLRKKYTGGEIRWIGWVKSTKKQSHDRHEIWVDLDRPGDGFSVYDAVLKVDGDAGASVKDGDYVYFTGTIESINRVFRSAIIDIVNVQIVPMAALKH
ncbi:MAG: hypothetical protein PVF65_10945 [Sphingomonadales bacterium]